jgi:hypothetical protein
MNKQDAVKLYGLIQTALQELICVYHELSEKDRKSLLPVIDMIKQEIAKHEAKKGRGKGVKEYRQKCHYHCPFNNRLTSKINNNLCPGCGYKPTYEVVQ